MLLITMKEWLGPGRQMSITQAEQCYKKESHVAFATRLPLGEALERIVNYQSVFNEHSVLGLTLSLLHVVEMAEINADLLDAVQVSMVEELPQSLSEMKCT